MQPTSRQTPETEQALRTNIVATFNASGVASGSVSVGPNRRWEVTLLNTSTTSTTQTRVTVYRNMIGGQRLDFSRTGNGDTSNTMVKLRQGESIWCEWTGGTPNTVAKLDIDGTEYVKGLRNYGV